jgi:GH24 family phage-related lysozyme (muramidase)
MVSTVAPIPPRFHIRPKKVAKRTTDPEVLKVQRPVDTQLTPQRQQLKNINSALAHSKKVMGKAVPTALAVSQAALFQPNTVKTEELVNDKMLDYLVSVEGFVPDDSGKLTVPYPSREGDGTMTWGYGRKGQKGQEGEIWTHEEARTALREDAKRAGEHARSYVNLRFGEGVFESMPYDRQRALLDIQYNVKGGLKTFPKFTTAIVAGDQAGALAEHERGFTDESTGKRRKLTRRNEKFVKTFLSDKSQFGQLTIAGQPAQPSAPRG